MIIFNLISIHYEYDRCIMHVQDYKQYLKDLSLNYHFYYSLYIYV